MAFDLACGLALDVAVVVLVDDVAVVPIWGFRPWDLLVIPVWAGGLLIVLLGKVVIGPSSAAVAFNFWMVQFLQIRGLQPPQ